MPEAPGGSAVSAPSAREPAWPAALAWSAIAAVALLVAAWFHLDASAQRLCCDAQQYWTMAGDYAAHGWFAPHPVAGLRTYAYPTLLAAVTGIAQWIGALPRDVLFAVQFALHVATAALLARAVFPGRPRAAWATFAALACNPYAAAYLPVALTDASSLAAFQAWLACVACWYRRQRTGGGGMAWFAAAAVLAGLACALRPAYVWLPVIGVVLALAPVAGRFRPAALVLALVLPWLALAPQVAINAVLFDRATPLPVADLGRTQLGWGIANLKYATAPRPGSEARMFYANPIPGDTWREGDGAGWYLRHPARGAATLAAKLAGAFDFDFLQAYVWNREPAWSWLYRPWPLLLLVFGLQGAWLYARRGAGQARNHVDDVLPSIGPRLLPALAFTAWAAVTLASVVELRFSLPMLALLLPLALGAVLDLRHQARAVVAARLAFAAAASGAAWALAAFVSAQNVLI
ncbi:hypothetical protein [Luteimonas sp. MC1750]|uniref:hypothetical protein n=1 Tax=Luteimonas sp. MC1750 TaxID=2799326 RepID=UPI0018F05F6C|nr:hypothetical protein [Luteimonas sp. MC1750]MBJ6983282.1 hypothetical protein [Luteimonas sp. MC1750]QQO06148.1 hypothetical protein JGR68_01460 [Luteimonas sp. MC1750]